MSERVALLLVPGLREADLEFLPALAGVAVDVAPLAASFPGVSRVVQMGMVTGLLPRDHGVIGDFSLQRPNLTIDVAPQSSASFGEERIWETIRAYDADFRCHLIGLSPAVLPADVTKPAWLTTEPVEPLTTPAPEEQCDTTFTALAQAVAAGTNLVIARLAHLEQAGACHGPESGEFVAARMGLDQQFARLWTQTGDSAEVTWLIASEFVISPVQRIVRPNRILRQAGWLHVANTKNPNTSNDGPALIDFASSHAVAVADHQAAHVFWNPQAAAQAEQQSREKVPTRADIASAFQGVPGIADVLLDEGKQRLDVDHPSAGDIVLVADVDAAFSGEFSSRQAWHGVPDAALAQAIGRGWISAEARNAAFPPATLGSRIRLPGEFPAGTWGGPVVSEQLRGVIIATQAGILLGGSPLADFDLAGLILRQFGI